MKIALMIVLLAATIPSFGQNRSPDLINPGNGSEGVGGGDEVGLDFKRSFLRSLEKSKKISPDFFNKIMSEKLNELAEEVGVFVTEDTIPVKDQNLIQNSVAYNDPRLKKILINRARWTAIRDTEIKEAIALHEYASIRGLERTGFYPLSSKYISLVGGNPEKLHLNLNVDRLKQVMAEMPGAHKADVVQRLFNTAVSASTDDVPFLSQALNYWGGCAAYNPAALKSAKPFSLIVAKYFAKVTSEFSQSPEDGPLFQLDPTQNEPKLVMEQLRREFVEGMSLQLKKGDYYPQFQVFKDSSITQSYSGPLEDSRPFALEAFTNTPEYFGKLSLRKDDRYLYFASSGKIKTQPGIAADPIYGYCWRK